MRDVEPQILHQPPLPLPPQHRTGQAPDGARLLHDLHRRNTNTEHEPVYLLQLKSLIALGRCLGTLGPIGWGGEGVEQDSAGLPRNIRAHKPRRLGLRKNRAGGHLVDVLYPRVFHLRLGGNTPKALLAYIADGIGNPFDDRLGANRVVTKRGVDGNEEVREARGLQPQVVARPMGPLVLDRLSPFAANIDPRQRSRHGIKPRGIDDDVEFILLLTGLDAFGRDALDRGLAHVHQQDIVAIVRFVIVGL